MLNSFVVAPGLRESFLFPIEMAIRIVGQRADDWAQEHMGLNRRMFWILLCVRSSRLNQRQLSDALCIHPNVMVKLLDTMERKGYIKRVEQEDRRSYLIEATKKGRGAAQIGLDLQGNYLHEVFAPLTEAQTRTVREWSLSILRMYDPPHTNMNDD
jgi:DNA-binding MarR family transcriptional regulator